MYHDDSAWNNFNLAVSEQVLITPFRKMVVPPPMAAYSLQLPGPVNQVMFAPPSHSNDIATVMHDGKVAFYKAATGECELCWFQTSLPLCRVIIACCFTVAALNGNAALALSPSGIAPELNRIQLSAICCGGQSGKVIDLLA